MKNRIALPNIAEIFPFWQDVSTKDRHELSRYIKCRALDQGDVFFSDDELTVSTLYVSSGELCYYTINENGRDTTLYRLYKGQYSSFLEARLYDSQSYPLMMQAELPSEIYSIAPEVSRYLYKSYPSVQKFERDIFYERSSFVMDSLQRMLSISSRQRLAMFLVDETQRSGSRTIVMTQEQIGRYVGTHREMISRMMNVFARRGIVRMRRGRIEVLNINELKKIAQ